MKRWFPILLLIVVALLAWRDFVLPDGVASTSAGGYDADKIRVLAGTVRPDEVVMYSTTACSCCKQAKAWLNSYGFAFTECNLSDDPRCEWEFRSHGAKGVPYVVVNRAGKTHNMKGGFDPHEFLAALQP